MKTFKISILLVLLVFSFNQYSSLTTAQAQSVKLFKGQKEIQWCGIWVAFDSNTLKTTIAKKYILDNLIGKEIIDLKYQKESDKVYYSRFYVVLRTKSNDSTILFVPSNYYNKEEPLKSKLLIKPIINKGIEQYYYNSTCFDFKMNENPKFKEYYEEVKF